VGPRDGLNAVVNRRISSPSRDSFEVMRIISKLFYMMFSLLRYGISCDVYVVHGECSAQTSYSSNLYYTINYYIYM